MTALCWSILEQLSGIPKHDRTLREAESIAYSKRCVEIFTDSNPRFFIVKGSRDHVVIPFIYCSCPDFIIRSVCQNILHPCKHILACYIAEKLGIYVRLDCSVRLARIILEEVLEKGISVTLRRQLERGETYGEEKKEDLKA